MPTFWKRDERPAQSIVVGGDNRLVTGHGVSLLIFWVGTNRLDISRYFKIVLHSQAPAREALAGIFGAIEIGKNVVQGVPDG